LEEPFILLPELFIKAADAIISSQEKQIFKLFYFMPQHSLPFRQVNLTTSTSSQQQSWLVNNPGLKEEEDFTPI
jgi:hypothetical protein